MPQRKRPQPTAKLTKNAAQLLLSACSKLKPDRATLSNLDQAAANLKEAAQHLDQATASTEQEPSTAIILRAAANAASAAQDHLAQAHQDLEDAYITDQGGTSPQAIKATLRKAAAALKETQSALELLNEDGTTNTEPPFAPPELTEARHNKAILAICAAALIITAALAVYNTQAFAQTAAVVAFACQQAIMFWAFMASTRPRATTKRMDFYACVALGLTIMLAGCLFAKGLSPRAALPLTAAAFLLATVEWAVARASALYTQKTKA